MPESTDAPRPDEEEVEGGPVKTFLEHLEDLRWTIIKSLAATLVAMCICLFALPQVVAILKWPLERAKRLPHIGTNQVVSVMVNKERIANFTAVSNRWGSLDLGTNTEVTVALEPFLANDQFVLQPRIVGVGPGTEHGGVDLIYLDPSAPFLSSLNLAFMGGLMLASPFVLYFIAQFVVPALKLKEKKYFSRAFFAGLFLFVAGVCTAYFGVMPRALQFAEVYANWMGVSVPNWKAETYFSFLLKFMLGMGLGFELPVVLLALVKIGLLDYAKLKAMRPYMVVGNLIIGALLTTPEVFTQIVMAIVLQILFEASVWIAWYWERQERRKETKS